MPDRDGATCSTCLTLNPPAAPACVRCNTPLATGVTSTRPPGAVPAGPATRPDPGGADPLLGSKRIGPGLGEGARGAPGSSRAHAAAVQPPGYGPHGPSGRGGPDGEAPAGAGPEADPAVARRVTVVGLVLVALVLAVGGGALWLTRSDRLDSRDVEAAVGAELSRRGGGTVTVTCPGGPRHRAGETFPCVASDAAGGRRTLTVTVLDDAGRYRWTLDR